MYGKILIRCDLEVRTGMHIGGSSAFSAIGAVDSPVVRDPYTGYPIVPGSSLKGNQYGAECLLNFHPGKFAVEFRSGITENRFTPAGCNLEAPLRGNQLNLAGFRGEPAFFQIDEPCRDNIACRHSRQHI